MGKILCIEDETEFREDIIAALKKEGHETFEASDGIEGFHSIIENKPDIILCDVYMPNMTGFELLQKLKEDAPECTKNPFIFISALGKKTDVLKGLDLNATDYLVKPIDFDILRAMVRCRLNNLQKQKQSKEKNTLYTNEILPSISKILQSIDELKQYIDIVQSETKHLSHVIAPEGMYGPTNISLHDEATNLTGLIKSTLTYVQHIVPNNHAEIKLEIPEELPQIFIDHKYFGKAFEKIITNALELTYDDQEISILVCRDKNLGILFTITYPLSRTRLSSVVNMQFAQDVIMLHGGTFNLEHSEGYNIIVISLPDYRCI